MKKKIFMAFVILVAMLGLCACGGKEENAPVVTSAVEQSGEDIAKESEADTNQTNEGTLEDAPVEIIVSGGGEEDKQEDTSVKEFSIDDFCGTFTDDEGNEITFSKVGDGYQVTNINLMINGSMKAVPDSRVASSDEIINAVEQDTNMRQYEIYFNDWSEEAQGCILTIGEWDDGTISILVWDTSMENWRTDGYNVFVTFTGVYK